MERDDSAGNATGTPLAPVPLPRTAFVVGCARSGTTWVRSVLQEHPMVVTGPETHVFPLLYGPLAAPRPPRAWRDAVLAAFDTRADADPPAYGGPHRWIERRDLEHLLDGALARESTGEGRARFVIGGVLGAFYRAHGGGAPGLLVEKTPRHIHHAEQILAWWPHARIVEVVRDGRDVCVSLHHKRRAARTWAPADLEEQARRWAHAVRRGLELRTRPELAARWLVVHYERMLTDGPSEIRRLYEFLGLPLDDALLEHVVASTSIRELRAPGNAHHLRKGVAGEWREHFDESDRRSFDAVAGDLLARLGYA